MSNWFWKNENFKKSFFAFKGFWREKIILSWLIFVSNLLFWNLFWFEFFFFVDCLTCCRSFVLTIRPAGRSISRLFWYIPLYYLFGWHFSLCMPYKFCVFFVSFSIILYLWFWTPLEFWWCVVCHNITFHPVACPTACLPSPYHQPDFMLTGGFLVCMWLI